MKRKLWINLLAGAAFFLIFGVSGVQTGEAQEAHHKKDVEAAASEQAETPGSGMKHSTGDGPDMMGMMGGSDDGDGHGMMEMMGQGMMGKGMMKMMMSHMMGGPGGMGKMMGKKGAGMKGHGGGPAGMKRMAHMLETLDLTDAQWNQVRNLARVRLEKMADLWAQKMKLRIEMAALNSNTDLDPEKVKDLFVRKAEVKAEMFLSGWSYLRDLKEILNEDQIKKLSAQGF